jgi:glycosyltransferase involved in cell wall biosynthesis
MENRKLRVGFVGDFCLAKTGFGRSMKSLLPILYKNQKYEIFTLNQGCQDNSPDFQRLPWKSEGVFRNFDQNRFNQDQGYQRWVAYGNAAISDFVLKNRLDIVVHQQDIWSSSVDAYLKSDWFAHIKNNFIQHSTADSVPILPDFKEWVKNCPNVWFWTSFAERTLKEEDSELYKTCKTVHGPIKSEDFYPLSKEDRLNLRRSFGISDDEKIIIYLGRNQLRKIFPANMEALVEFRKKHPNKKLRLLFHCSWNEGGMGWPLQRIMEELKLKKEDILTTYYCKTCGHWNIQPYDGEDLNCGTCNNQKTRITAGVGSTITEFDLNKIYNLADGSSSVCTSAGLEYTNVESLLAGIPLATVPYSGCEEFTPNNFVKTIRGTFTRECSTAFKKFVPNIDSIVEFFEFIYNLKEHEKRLITEKGRKWAIEQFDANNIAKIFCDFFDSCQPIDWDIFFNKKKELKDPNAPVDQSLNDEDYILSLYSSVLKMTDMKSKPDVDYWKNELKNGKSRQEVEQTFRQIAAQKNAEMQQISFESLLLNNGKKQFLLVCPESAGDCLYTSATLKSFRKSYPESEWNLYLATKPEFIELFDCNPYVSKILPFQEFMNSEITCLGQGTGKKMFDGYCFITALSQRYLSYLGNHNINLELV